MSRPDGRFHRDDRGNVAATAAVVPAVLLLFMLIVQLGLWFHARAVATAAAQHALEAARVEGGTNGAGTSAAQEFVGQVGGVAGDDVAVSFERTPERLTVTVQADAVVVMPGFDVPVTVTLSGPVERIMP